MKLTLEQEKHSSLKNFEPDTDYYWPADSDGNIPFPYRYESEYNNLRSILKSVTFLAVIK